MNYNGTPKTDSNGTSFAAPYIAGIFAAGCQAVGNLCDTMPTALTAYNELRNQAGVAPLGHFITVSETQASLVKSIGYEKYTEDGKWTLRTCR